MKLGKTLDSGDFPLAHSYEYEMNQIRVPKLGLTTSYV